MPNTVYIRAIKLMAGRIADAVVEGLEMRTIDEADRAAAQPEAYEPAVEEEAEEKPEPEIELEGDAEPDEYLGPSILARLAKGIDGENEAEA